MDGMWSAEELSALAGVALSLACSYLPGVRQRFSRLEPTQKRLVMLGLLMVCSVAIFGVACLPPEGGSSGAACSREGAVALGRIFLVALIANQGAYEISPQPRGQPV